jgi:hypothetical protein
MRLSSEGSNFPPAQVWVKVSVAEGGRIRLPPLALQLLHPSDAGVPLNQAPQPLDVKRASLAAAAAGVAEAAEAAEAAAEVREG